MIAYDRRVRHRKCQVLGGVEELKKIKYKGRPSELNQSSDILKEYFEKSPASTVAEASDAIERLTSMGYSHRLANSLGNYYK